MSSNRLRRHARAIAAVALSAAAIAGLGIATASGEPARAPAASTGATGPQASTGPKISIQPRARIAEGDRGSRSLRLRVTLSRTHDRDVTARYKPSPASARPRQDYAPKGGAVTIPAGKRRATITVDIKGDRRREMRREQFDVLLTRVNHATFGRRSNAMVTIVDDD